jgi:CheY-like chemotaxis protein
MVRLVDDLLDVSRITRGEIELRPQQVELSGVLAKGVEMASMLLEQRQHRLSLDVEPGVKWVGDPARLAQVISNLLTNAARYTNVGGDIHLRAWWTAADRLAVSVRDNGIGLSPEQLPKLFDLFFQAKQTLDRPEGGLGIGLALVKSLVEMHGGTVRAFSEGLGRGSEFVVELPLLSLDSVLPENTPSEDDRAKTYADHRHLLVAVVDDNADNADLMGALLRAEGFSVVVFHDPASALAGFSERCPDLAILDIGLPVMDGYELAAQLRKLPGGERCQLVALTGYGQQEDRDRSAASGFQCHLVKPAKQEDVVSNVRKLLDADRS